MSDDEKELEKGEESKAQELAEVEPEEEPQLGEVLQKLSEERPEVKEMISMMMTSGPMANPLHDKLNSDHITKALEFAEKHDERQFSYHSQSQRDDKEDRTANRRYAAGYFAAALIFVCFLIWQFRTNPDFLIPLLTAVGGVVGGFAGGFGYARSKE